MNEFFENMNNEEILRAWNDYCDEEYKIEKVYKMEDLEEVTEDIFNPDEIAEADSQLLCEDEKFFRISRNEKTGKLVIESSKWADDLMDLDKLESWMSE